MTQQQSKALHRLARGIMRIHNLRESWRRQCAICRHYYGLRDALANDDNANRKALQVVAQRRARRARET